MRLDTQNCGKIIITILATLIVLHLAVLLEILPMNIVWGGRLQSRNEMIQFELIAIIINILIALTVAMKIGLIKKRLPGRLLHVSIWVIAFMFTTNIFTNLLAIHWFEKWVMGSLTVILSFLFIRLALLTKGENIRPKPTSSN